MVKWDAEEWPVDFEHFGSKDWEEHRRERALEPGYYVAVTLDDYEKEMLTIKLDMEHYVENKKARYARERDRAKQNLISEESTWLMDISTGSKRAPKKQTTPSFFKAKGARTDEQDPIKFCII